MSVLPVLAAGAGGILGSMYIDSKLLISKDLTQLSAGLVGNVMCKVWDMQDRAHFYFRFKEKAKSMPHSLFVIFEGKEYTFRQIEKASNRLAHWLMLEKNVKKGDIICMMLQNHPTFFILLFAISKIGATPSLINTNLSEDSLLHCIKIADTKYFFFDPLYEKQAATIVEGAHAIGTELFAYGEATEETEVPNLPFATAVTPSVLKNFSEKDTSKDFLRGVKPNDAAYLIYTSGTTGMPKAAISQHFRINFAINFYRRSVGINSGDRVYCVLPLYHSSGMIVCATTTMYSGGTIILGRKFSASRFWHDIYDYKVNAFAYIGEFCRYLLTQPNIPKESTHCVRTVYGNGMRPDVWDRFRDRFNIPRIVEFYAATEGPGGVMNINTGELGKGAVGFRGKLFRTIKTEIQIIQIDPITEEPVRGKDGFCIKADYDAQGELVVRLDNSGPITFDGYYKNNGATDKKILNNVFVKGDSYFRSGDLLKLTRDGFYYFGDRIGDTFRWKSENVATTEVSQAIGDFPGIVEANVYGALVPNHDGRAGMAAIVVNDGTSLDFAQLCQHLRNKLPKYAVPLFLRFVPAMDITGTFKQQKVELRNQGIDLSKIPETDPVFWLKGNTYVPFTTEDYSKIFNGQVKL